MPVATTLDTRSISLPRGSYSLVNKTSVCPPYLCCSTFIKQQLTGIVKFLIKSARNTNASSRTPTTVKSLDGMLEHISEARALIRLCMSSSDHTTRIFLSINFLGDRWPAACKSSRLPICHQLLSG